MLPSKHWNKKQNKRRQIKKNKPWHLSTIFSSYSIILKSLPFLIFWAVSYTIFRIFRLFKTLSQWGELDTALGSFRRTAFSSWTNDGRVFSSWLYNLDLKLVSIDKSCHRRVWKVNWPFLQLNNTFKKQP